MVKFQKRALIKVGMGLRVKALPASLGRFRIARGGDHQIMSNGHRKKIDHEAQASELFLSVVHSISKLCIEKKDGVGIEVRGNCRICIE